MATRSTIALEYSDGSIKQVYCHNDGYIEHNGKILQEQYTDPNKLNQIIELGDLSCLGRNIANKHDYDYHGANVCIFYGRDRGETEILAEIFSDYEDYLANYASQEFNYILREINSKYVWFVSHIDSNYKFEKLEFAYLRRSVEILK